VVQRFAARRARKIPPVTQAPAKARGRWPSAAVRVERAGRRPEAKERVARESGSRTKAKSVPETAVRPRVASSRYLRRKWRRHALAWIHGPRGRRRVSHEAIWWSVPRGQI
jgi:hypothetical protein